MRALITGPRGQDGTLLRSLLASHGYEVVGVDRPGANADPERAAKTVGVELTDEIAVERLFREIEPDQVYHLAACHHSSEQLGDVRLDREMVQTNFRAAEVLIATIAKVRPSCRIMLAGSSQMYRATEGQLTIVDEETPMRPASFYGYTKAWSRDLLAHYRKYRGVFGSMAILFNHESSLRTPKFLTRKVTMAAARAKYGECDALSILDITRETDWSSASDVVEGMRLALSAREPSDYVLASGVPRRVQDVLEIAFDSVGLRWREFVTVESPAVRPRGTLVGDPTRARTLLHWKPNVEFEQMIRDMVAFDLALVRTGRSH